MLKNPLKHETMIHNISTEYLVQTHEGPVHAISISVRFAYVDLEGLFSWCPPSPLDFRVFRSSHS